MEANALLVRTALAIPVICALSLFIWFRSERKIVHGMMAALIASILPWLVGTAMRVAGPTEAIRSLGLDLEHVTGFWMPAFFAASMGYFARLRTFEASPGAALACLASAPIFTAIYLVDAIEPLYFAERAIALAGGEPQHWAGPVYWASKLWAVALNGAGFAFLGCAVFRGRTVHERRRAVALVAAAGAPATAHFAFVASGNPVLEQLTPLALVVTAVAVIYGAHRHGLLDGPPLVRTDVLDHLREAMILTNEVGVVVDVNERALAALGVDREDAMSVRLPDLLALAFGIDVADGVARQVMALSPADDELAIVLAGAQDDQSWFELSASALRSQTSQSAGRIVLIRDRSVERRAERLMSERQKRESVGILAAGVAHEVNNPLAYVRANLNHVRDFASALAEGKPEAIEDGHEIPDIVTDALEGLDRIEQIVRQLVRFSATPDERFGPVDVNAVVADALRLADLDRRGTVRVDCDLEASLPAVRGSANRLVQALLNLVLNARQALGDARDPRISVESASEGERVVIRVRDNGPGIEPEDAQRIFDPFFTTRDPDEGTGLGLAIGSDIAREHGGTLSLEPAEAGACFALRLPVRDDAESVAAERASGVATATAT